jgi:hypothetical protein
MLDFVADNYDVTGADMNNYSGDIVITGTDEDGATIRIEVAMRRAEKDA